MKQHSSTNPQVSMSRNIYKILFIRFLLLTKSCSSVDYLHFISQLIYQNLIVTLTLFVQLLLLTQYLGHQSTCVSLSVNYNNRLKTFYSIFKLNILFMLKLLFSIFDWYYSCSWLIMQSMNAIHVVNYSYLRCWKHYSRWNFLILRDTYVSKTSSYS